MFKFLKQKNNGFTLIEVLVAISLFSITLVTVMTVLGGGITDVNYAKKKITAEYLAQEGIEYVRNLRDTGVLFNTEGAAAGWGDFIGKFSFCNPNCNISPYNEYPNSLNGDSSTSISGFSRVITMAEINPGNEAKITSTVSWDQGSGRKSVSFTESLFKWVEVGATVE